MRSKPTITIPAGDPPADLLIEDDVVGDGTEATVGSTVVVHYCGVAWSSGQQFDASWDRKLTKGAVVPDRTLDLHGHHLDGAWSAIDDGLERAIAAGDRVVLLITGHARSGEPPLVRGRIRAAVHDWLAHSRHARHIAAVRAAHPRHGGGGSLYLILRKPR